MIESKKKSVCIIRSNPVNPDSRVEKEAWTLIDLGYDVNILAWDRSNNSSIECSSLQIMGKEIPITRLCYKASFGEGLKNIIPYLKFQFAMRKWLRRNHFDVIHACDFDTAFFSQGVVSKKSKFVFDIFDFICGEPKSFLQHCVKSAQLKIINKSDATILCTEEREQQISGSHPKKLVFIHNTPIAEMINVNNFVVNKSDKIKIVYVGILQDFRLLKEITNCIVKDDRFEFHIGGFGKYENFFVDMAQKYNNITFYGKLSYDQTLSLESQCDIMLAVYDPSIENHRFAAPNKFYESLMLGKPVVMVRGTGMAAIVEKQDLGVLIDYSEEGFSIGLTKLLERRNEWQNMCSRAQLIYKEKYNWNEMRNRLKDLYESL